MSDFFCIADNPKEYHECFMQGLVKRNPGEPEFHQAASEVASTLLPYVFDHKKYIEAKILERLTEPDRVISFRVCWEDDKGDVRVNRGYRVQFNNSIGPYKGGLRFHPSVNQSVLKFLGFEQIFKNSLTTLPIGGGKGGSDFDPKGKSDREIMRFCQSFMTELYRHIGENTDVPAGDIGVGAKEVSYMFGQYKRLVNRFTGVLTGKGLEFGGSHIRTEATGYGLIYFTMNALEHNGDSLDGKVCLVSGSGNVAQYAAQKLMSLNAKVVAMSDSRGTLYMKNGLTVELLDQIRELKLNRQPLAKLENPGAEYREGQKPWGIEADFAFPCATQNEIDLSDAKALTENGCKGVFEGANMPCTNEAIEYFQEKELFFGPAKAANAGGVAISALEMSQNSMGMSWDAENVDSRLKQIMSDIHKTCVLYGEKNGRTCYLTGANIGGFVKVADAMLAYGIN
ncbi:MAG: NADP-specific glutamate dehydrogenase [Bdellovibrionales bacterium]|nr:NADP-specific glutamate dehydrogenase [Bdellovibrionales bacterium]